jgi:hypothetical protein
MMRPPPARVLFTKRAVDAPTSNHSGCGASPASCDETPVCSSTGAMPTPRDTRRVTTSGVNGRAALGISALPGVVPKIVW